MTLTNYAEQKLLEHMAGTAYTAPTQFVALSTTWPTEAGANFTEPTISTNAYARVTMSGKWGAVSSGDPSTIANNTAASFPESTGAWASGADLIAWGTYDASSAGNLLRFDWLGRTSSSDKYYNPADVNTTTNRLTLTSHGYTNADSVVFQVPAGSTLAAGLTANTRYYAKVIDANTLEIYTDLALSSIVDITTAGTGTQIIFKIVPRKVDAAGITLSFSSGNLVQALD
jgi:hypothetical protein